jgi:hypothetical protein
MTDDDFARYVIKNWLKGVILGLVLGMVWQCSVLHRNLGEIKNDIDAMAVSVDRLSTLSRKLEGLGDKLDAVGKEVNSLRRNSSGRIEES